MENKEKQNSKGNGKGGRGRGGRGRGGRAPMKKPAAACGSWIPASEMEASANLGSDEDSVWSKDEIMEWQAFLAERDERRAAQEAEKEQTAGASLHLAAWPPTA